MDLSFQQSLTTLNSKPIAWPVANCFVALDLTSETQALLENLPAKAVVHFQVTAHNAASESAKSAVASVILS